MGNEPIGRVCDRSSCWKSRGLDSVQPKNSGGRSRCWPAFQEDVASKLGPLQPKGSGTHKFKARQRLGQPPCSFWYARSSSPDLNLFVSAHWRYILYTLPTSVALRKAPEEC